MGHRIDGLPSAGNITTPIPIPSLPSFSGLDEDPTQFSAWLARVEDIFDMLSPPLSSAMKAKLVKGHLQGKSFEGPHRRRLARQALSGCRQQPGESCFSFANRILHLVRAITAGQDPALQEERLLEEFQALDTADAVEQHLAETISDRLITPSSGSAPLEVKTVNLRPSRPSSRNYEPRVSRRSNSFQGRGRSRRMGNVISRFNTDRTVCYSCGGLGHMAHQCPTQRQQPKNT
ncbi:unnamed protein product, partial [Cylicostephanus goldi]